MKRSFDLILISRDRATGSPRNSPVIREIRGKAFFTPIANPWDSSPDIDPYI